MKRSHGIAIAVFALIVLTVTILQVVGSLLGEDPATRKSLTIDDLDFLVEELAASEANNAPQSPPALAAANPPADPAPETLPRRLERATTREERTRKLDRRQLVEGLLCRTAGTSGAFDVLISMGGRHDISAWYRGETMVHDGEWQAARGCFTTVLEESQDPLMRRGACMYLAWMEDDPELAARYLELACHDDAYLQTGNLKSAYELAQLTGSEALAAHYRARYEDLVSTILMNNSVE